jgi:hypothetical protein
MKDYIQNSLEALEDVLSEVSMKDLKTKEEKEIYLSVKNLRNIVDAAHGKLSMGKLSKVDNEKLRGLIVKSLKTAGGIIGRIKDLIDTSEASDLMQGALSVTMKNQGEALKMFK